MSAAKASMIHGILLIALFACASFYIGEIQILKELSISPMIIGIILGMMYANSLRSHLPDTWVPGIQFCSKRLLRIGIIFYGFRLTLQDIVIVGLPGVIIDVIVVTVTIIGGVMIGRLLRMDRETALLTSVGSGICGAAAVLGTEATIRSQPYKTAVAVATVVIFGTIGMFLYPALYNANLLDLDAHQMGIYSGSTLHEVAHAVGAGNAMGADVANGAIIVKMIRVMLLVAVLLVLSVWCGMKPKNSAKQNEDTTQKKSKISIPWFAVLFLCVIIFNSFIHLPQVMIDGINYADTFVLTMAMAALGAETSFDKFKKAGAKPFILAFCLDLWLIGGGWVMAKYLVPLL